MANTTPEKRMDKNGRMVTRHVKTPTAPASPPAFIPPPGSITLGSKVDGVRSMFYSHRVSKSYSLDDLDQNAVAEVEKLLATYKGPGKNPMMGLQVSIHEALGLIDSEGIHNELNNLAVFGKHIFPHINSDVNQYVRAIHELTAPDEFDYLNGVSKETRASAEGLVRFTVLAEKSLGDKVVRYSTEIEDEVFDYTELRDMELTNFIWANPDKADAVLDILIQEKNTLPVAIIQERLNHNEKSLMGGVL